MISSLLQKRMLNLRFHKKYSTQPCSIRNHLNNLSSLLLQLRLPSTTTRIPRNLLEYENCKANELRRLLLFGHTISSEILNRICYSHLLQLVVLIHMAEARSILPQQLYIIQQLSVSFVLDFAKLYTPRHCVQCVHSILHIPATTESFGPLTNFTTYNFEDILGEAICFFHMK